MKRIGKIISKQDPFNVGVTLKVVSDIIIIDDNIQDPSKYCSNLKGGEWKELKSNECEGSIWTGTKFIPAQPYASWTFNDTDNAWIAPVLKPNNPYTEETGIIDGKNYTTQKDTYKIFWNETNSRWEGLKLSDNNNYYWNPNNFTWVLL